MVRLLFIGFFSIFGLIGHSVMAQTCTPTPPSGPFDYYWGTSSGYGDVPLGVSVVRFFSGFGASDDVQVSFSATMDACSDPDFSVLGIHCDYVEGGRSCYAVVSFMPTTPGYKTGIAYGTLYIVYPPELPYAPISELDTIYLGGTGIDQLSADLSIAGISITDGPTVPVGKPVVINVTVAAAGLGSPESRSAVINLQAAGQTFSQMIALSTLVGGSKIISFEVTFGDSDIGSRTISASFGSSAVPEDNYTNNTATLNIQVLANCPTPPLTPLTDPVALEFEAANGNIVDVEHLDANLNSGRLCLMNRLTRLGQNPVTTSGYRPQQYQNHLREVYLKWEKLKKEKSPACDQLRSEVQAEMDKHRTVFKPVVNSLHTLLPARAFDLSWGNGQRPTILRGNLTIDWVARQCGLRRPDAGDPVHFISR